MKRPQEFEIDYYQDEDGRFTAIVREMRISVVEFNAL
jgi:hypothetical protein